MPQIVIAVGVDPEGNLSNLYTGSDSVAALEALKTAQSPIGYIYENPIAVTTLRAPSAQTPQAPAPTITALNPNTGPANADITVAITGTGFDSAPTVTIGAAYGLVPSIVTPTDLSVLVSGAANIQFPGVLSMSVQNSDGQTSNALDFTVT
jgi:IPT/TIG domain